MQQDAKLQYYCHDRSVSTEMNYDLNDRASILIMTKPVLRHAQHLVRKTLGVSGRRESWPLTSV
jgi:hypothetical protein